MLEFPTGVHAAFFLEPIVPRHATVSVARGLLPYQEKKQASQGIKTISQLEKAHLVEASNQKTQASWKRT